MEEFLVGLVECAQRRGPLRACTCGRMKARFGSRGSVCSLGLLVEDVCVCRPPRTLQFSVSCVGVIFELSVCVIE